MTTDLTALLEEYEASGRPQDPACFTLAQSEERAKRGKVSLVMNPLRPMDGVHHAFGRAVYRTRAEAWEARCSR